MAERLLAARPHLAWRINPPSRRWTLRGSVLTTQAAQSTGIAV
jgi:hypothetical protein